MEAALRKVGREFGSVLRRTATEHVETREGVGLERVVSCGRSEQRWRAKLDLASGKSLDDLHQATTLGAAPEVM